MNLKSGTAVGQVTEAPETETEHLSRFQSLQMLRLYMSYCSGVTYRFGRRGQQTAHAPSARCAFPAGGQHAHGLRPSHQRPVVACWRLLPG